ncbi:hypothetical protein [Coleofasciculus chthonoplastes]|jgi:hypothetical protein|uniref:hypothetical protein n=1 Tax=Coleofasciculus chthonoplastes TaxID=64178 RepID=UPI0032FEF265
MFTQTVINRIATPFAISGFILSILTNTATAATTLDNNDSVRGFIQTNSSSFRYRNDLIPNAPMETAAGEEYRFNAQQGDTVRINVKPEDSSSLSPILVLSSSQTGNQVLYNDKTNLLVYQVPMSGEYKLLVLGRNNTRGRYTVSISGITPGLIADNPSNQTPDERKQLLQNDFGLRVLENCPSATGSLVVVSFPESDQTYTYCANPNRFLQTGQYTYDASTETLKPGRPGTQTASNQTTDPRQEKLEDEYGLNVLNTCPPATNSLVVISYPEDGQTYRYCADPNRVFPAGNYTYNASTQSLNPVKKPEACTVQVGGICIVR